MNTDGEMLPIPPVEIRPVALRAPVMMTQEDNDAWNHFFNRSGRKLLHYATRVRVGDNEGKARRADDKVMLTRTMCPEAKPAVKDLAVFLKFSQ
jgi:hypothetical protein